MSGICQLLRVESEANKFRQKFYQKKNQMICKRTQTDTTDVELYPNFTVYQIYICIYQYPSIYILPYIYFTILNTECFTASSIVSRLVGSKLNIFSNKSDKFDTIFRSSEPALELSNEVDSFTAGFGL